MAYVFSDGEPQSEWLKRNESFRLYWFELNLNLLFNVTINDISVIYVTAHRCAGGLKKKLDLRSGSRRHRHFVGFFNVPVLAPTRDHPFYTVIPTHRPIKSPFTITLGIRRTHSRLNPPPGPHRGILVWEKMLIFSLFVYCSYCYGPAKNYLPSKYQNYL